MLQDNCRISKQVPVTTTNQLTIVKTSFHRFQISEYFLLYLYSQNNMFKSYLIWGDLLSFSSVWLCNPMGCSMPGFPVLHHLLELAQTHVYWISDAIQPSHPLLLSSCLQSVPASGSFSTSWLFISAGQSTGASVSVSVLLMNIQDWFSLGLTGLISLHSKGLSSVFFNTTDGRHQFFGSQPSLQSNSHIHTRLMEKP